MSRTFCSSSRKADALLLCVIASLWLGVIACRHDASSLPMPGTLWAHLKNERFGTVTSIGGLPLGVRHALQELFHSPSLDIAEPDGDFRQRTLGAAPGG